MYILLTS